MEHIREYFQEIERLVSISSIIASHEINYEEKSKNIGILYGKIIIVDSRILEFLELVKLEPELNLMKYRYQIMDSNCSLVARYDNAPHHREISTFPDHKHFMKMGKEIVQEAEKPDLSKILKEITESI